MALPSPSPPSAKSLTPGVSYTGQVSSREADGTYRVTTDDPKITISGVRLALPALGGHLGLQIRCLLTPLTDVKLVYGNPSFIYAVIPKSNADPTNGRTRSILWGPSMDGETGIVDGDLFSDHAVDMLEGEVEFSNLYGVSLQFLTALMRMSAGDRAAVECHLINDMVRVISGQWRHISGLGEDLIFDHGRPTLERNWSMYRHEVLGALAEKQPYAEMNGDEVNREALDAKRVASVGRNRFREFVGFAGDFIHSFVSDPPATLVSLAEGSAAAGAGKSWMHRNSDGSILIQSVADIRLERVVRIPVPVRYAHHEDPTVTAAREYDKLNSDYLKLPIALSPVDPKDAYQLAYHIRSYSRWLGRYHSFARMLQLSDEYQVPSETESPAPDWNNAEADRMAKNGGVTYYDAYACISIMRDGSIVTQDGYGSSIVMSNGNLQLSATRHLDLEAAGDIRMLAGGSILMKARRNIELSATLGGLILHSYAWLKMLCERGSMWLKSGAVTDKAIAPEPKIPGAPTPEIAGWESGSKNGFAVLVEASDGAAAYRSKLGVTVAVDGKPADAEDKSFDINIVTAADLALRGNRNAGLQSSKNVSISGLGLSVASQTVLFDAAELLVTSPTGGDPSLALRNGNLWCKKLTANSADINNIRGREVGARAFRPDRAPRVPLKPHLNHIGVLTSAVEAPDGGSETELARLTAARELIATEPTLPWGGSTEGPEWAFPPKTEYVWDDREKVAGVIPETLSQQYLRLDAQTSGVDRWGGLGYADWHIRSEVIGSRTNSRCGFGYSELQYQADDSGESLYEPSATAPADMENITTSWNPRARFSIKYLKREGES